MKGWLWKRMKTASQQPPFSFHQNNQEVKIGSRGCSFYFFIKQNSPTTSHPKLSKQYLLFPFFLMPFFFTFKYIFSSLSHNPSCWNIVSFEYSFYLTSLALPVLLRVFSISHTFQSHFLLIIFTFFFGLSKTFELTSN